MANRERIKKSLPQGPSVPEIAVDEFAAVSFRLEGFIARLAAPVLDKAVVQSQPGSQAGQPPLADVKQLLSHLERCCGNPVLISWAAILLH